MKQSSFEEIGAVLRSNESFAVLSHVLAELLEREGERELTAQGVAIRPNMAQNRETLMLAKRGSDLRESALCHSVSPAGVSICCRISKTRAPRSIESSR